MSDPNDDYDPHDHRNKSHPISNTETFIHFVKGNVGTGILALPEAFMYAGLMVGSIMTVILTAISTYNLHLLFNSIYALCKRNRVPEMPYPEALKDALLIGPESLRKFANAAPVLINFLIVFLQMGVCSVYVLFIASNIKNIVDERTSVILSVQLYVVFLLIPLFLIMCIPNLKCLVPFSVVANWVLVIGLAIILYYVYKDINPNEERTLVGSIYTLPLFMGTVIFSVGGFAVMLSLEANMKTPKRWLGWFGVLNHSMLWITALNILVGFSGYWKYGDKIKSSITLNLPAGEALSCTVMGLYAASIFISFALQFYPAVEIMWEQYTIEHMNNTNHPMYWQYGLRTGGVLFCLLLAIAVPRLGLFISLFGAFCLSALGLIFPGLMDICLHYPNNYGKYRYILYKDIFLIIFGIIGLITGTGKAVYDIIISFM